VQFRDFAVVDCGGGPFAHKVNGKDHGGGIEFTWIIDGRNRSATEVRDPSSPLRPPQPTRCLKLCASGDRL
jgi:hypothetical protein